MTTTRTPDFESPPVIETVLGLEFEPLPELEPFLFGLFWDSIRDDYPRWELQPPLLSQVEQFGEHAVPRASITFGDEKQRWWFIGANNRDLLQIQNNRFIWNWRKMDSGVNYPRYETTKPRFVSEWQRFLRFLDDQKIKQPIVLQSEVTYVNHLERGDCWETMEDLEKIFTIFGETRSRKFLPPAESFQSKISYVIPADRGRLHVEIKPVVRLSDQKQLIVFSLTARGKPNTSDINGIVEWFDLGREWIVQGFADLTSDAIHKHWGRKS